MTANGDRPNPVRDELDRATDPAERAELAGMIELGSLLSRVEPADPPSDLAPAVMRAVRAARARDRRTLAGRLRGYWPGGRAVLPYAYAAAAGAALCFVSIQVLTGEPLLGEAVQGRDAGGTMSGRSGSDVARLELSGAGVRGHAVLSDSQESLALDVDVDASTPVDLSVRFDPTTVRFLGISEPSRGFDQIEVADGSVRWGQAGTKRATVLFARVGPGPVRIDVAWKDHHGGRGGGSLPVPAAR